MTISRRGDHAELLGYPPLNLDTALPDSPTPSQSSGIWTRYTPQNVFARVYNSKRRNNYCLEYDEYKRVVSNIQMAFPNSPTGQLEFDDWVNMRLEKVENESKALQLKIDAATAKAICRGHGDCVGTNSTKQHPVMHRNTDAFQKITKSCPPPATDFNKDRLDPASLSSLRKYCDQEASVGPQVTGDGFGGPSLVAFLEASPKPGTASPHQWEKCRDLWNGIGCGVIRSGYGNHSLTSPPSSSAATTFLETPSTIGSPIAPLLPSPILSPCSSPETNATPHFDFDLGWAAAETQPFHDSHAPTVTGCDVGLGLDFISLYGKPDLSWIAGDELSDNGEFFCLNRHIWCGS